jgi:predicted GNAT family acetyltransferase
MAAVEHDAAGKRFVARLDAGEAELTYEESASRVLDLQHTFVPPEARGEGVGEELVQFAFSYARQNDYRIPPTCPFVRNWLEDHPEQEDIVTYAA